MVDDEDSVVSIEDVIKSIDEEKAIVMGGIKNQDSCSFISGYMKRQALYTCKTCLDISTTKAGFCYPCLVNCHEGHDTVELYTKRRFRCDCGNAKFGHFQCTLWEEKDDENIENQYNDNFSNCYCICKRPYPDEDYEGNEEMIQCGLCEDWYHLEHLNLPDNVKAPEDYEEMTCFLCLQKCAFLYFYALENEEESHCELSESIRRMLTSNTIAQNSQLETEREAKRCKLAFLSEDIGDKSEECHLSATIYRFGTKQSCDITLKDLDLSNASDLPSIFWSGGWRERLCKCTRCQTMYAHYKLDYLLDPQDTMSHYLSIGEKRAIEIDKEENEALSEALSELPHSVAINVAEGLGQLKKALEEFLSQKRDSGHIITEAEVRSFFEKLREQQRHL